MDSSNDLFCIGSLGRGRTDRYLEQMMCVNHLVPLNNMLINIPKLLILVRPNVQRHNLHATLYV